MSTSHSSSSPTRRPTTFPKSRRLLRRREFLRVQQKGRRIHSGPLLVCVLPSGEPIGRIGITTSRKVGKAVFRNRMRRLIRDAARRLFLPDELPFDVVFIVKKGLDENIEQREVDQAISGLLRRLKALQRKASEEREAPQGQEHQHGRRKPDE